MLRRDAIVEIESGVLSGLRDDATVLFHAIPYAQAPVGASRFAPPAPAKPWAGVRPARTPAPGAVQPWRTDDPWNDYFNPPAQSFDCLTLRVHAPADAERAPVVVWIHGGGFVTGVGTAPAHRGDTWARNGIVHVAINYRTGLDGFLMLRDSVETETDNLGLRDQIAALEWVRRNIAAFGGDPDNVTVMGQSGGAVCVAMLMVSPLTAGLFRRAVVQSGAPQGSFALDTAHARAEMVARLAGREPARGALRDLSEEDTRSVLQAADETAWSDLSLDEARLPVAFTVTHGTPSVPRPVLAALADGVAAGIPLLIGTTKDEAAGMLAKAGLTNPGTEAVLDALIEHLGISAETLAAYREARGTTSNLVAVSGVISDATFGHHSRRMAETHRGLSYSYEFGWQSPSLPAGMGADHTFDIPFVQNDFDSVRRSCRIGAQVLGEHPPAELAAEMHGAFVRFVKSGDPGWPAGAVKQFGSEPRRGDLR